MIKHTVFITREITEQKEQFKEKYKLFYSEMILLSDACTNMITSSMSYSQHFFFQLYKALLDLNVKMLINNSKHNEYISIWASLNVLPDFLCVHSNTFYEGCSIHIMS